MTEANICGKTCDHGSPCLLLAGHIPSFKHETQHGCEFHDVLDPNELTPGIRRTVLYLRAHDFGTCDSGDGVTNVEAGMEGAMPIPHVHILAKPMELVPEARRLRMLLAGVTWEPCGPEGNTGPAIECTYDPVSDVAIISLLHVDDALLERVGVLR